MTKLQITQLYSRLPKTAILIRFQKELRNFLFDLRFPPVIISLSIFCCLNFTSRSQSLYVFRSIFPRIESRRRFFSSDAIRYKFLSEFTLMIFKLTRLSFHRYQKQMFPESEKSLIVHVFFTVYFKSSFTSSIFE